MTVSVQETTKLSSIEGPALAEEANLGALTLGGFIKEVGEKYADREALCWTALDGQVMRWTYAEMLEECQQVAKALMASGVGRDARVGVLISNRPEWIFSTFGSAMLGATTVALNTFSTQQELNYQLSHADIQFLITEAGVASKDFIADIHELCPALSEQPIGQLHFEQLPFLRNVVCIDYQETKDGIQAWPEFLSMGDSISSGMIDATLAACSPVDRGLIFFSSGSTALPKAIQQTQRAAALQCWRFGNWYNVSQDVRTWSANGFFFSGNFGMAFGSTFTVGGCLVLQRFFSPDESLALLEAERVSLMLAWPHQEARLKECPAWETTDLSALKYVDKDLIMATHPSIDTDWIQPWGYGMTETFTFVVGASGGVITDGSHGPVLPGNTIRIVDPETGEILPMGETGEIIIKGPTLTTGYLKVAPEDMFDADGFIHTADAGYMNEAGNVCWKGRLGDIIKTGGANVSPSEIDAELDNHPAVQSAFTVGVPDELLGEIVVSCILLRENMSLAESELRAFAKKTLAAYKVPRRVLFFKDEDLPKTGSNKIRRPELRKLAQERLEAEAG